MISNYKQKLNIQNQHCPPEREISHSCLLTEVGLWQITHFGSMPGRQYRKGGGNNNDTTDGWKIQQLCQKIDSKHLHSHMHSCTVSQNKFTHQKCHFTPHCLLNYNRQAYGKIVTPCWMQKQFIWSVHATQLYKRAIVYATWKNERHINKSFSTWVKYELFILALRL